MLKNTRTHLGVIFFALAILMALPMAGNSAATPYRQSVQGAASSSTLDGYFGKPRTSNASRDYYGKPKTAIALEAYFVKPTMPIMSQ